jgi:hypothetical protein
MKRTLYFTHCSKKKDPLLAGSPQKTTPDKLYTATYLQRFIKRCRVAGVDWAIFSDRYGFLHPTRRVAWYELSPANIKGAEKDELFRKAHRQIADYEAVYFYHNPGRFHRLYRELYQYLKDGGINITLITHLADIKI